MSRKTRRQEAARSKNRGKKKSANTRKIAERNEQKRLERLNFVMRIVFIAIFAAAAIVAVVAILM
jgi:type IV secretory pathway component VirB8